MKRKMKKFNDNMGLRLSACNQRMKIKADRDDNLKEGELNTQRKMTQYTFKEKYPTEDASILENLTLEQYEQIFKMLIKNDSITDIKEKLKMSIA